jgi:hypothetical protein
MTRTPLSRLRAGDRIDLERVRSHLHAAFKALRRDECGDPCITGSRGAIRANSGVISVYVVCRSARHWGYVRKSLLGFCAVTQDGDEEGVLRLERPPIGDEIAQLRDAIGLRQTRPGNPLANLPPRSPGKLAA